jgi:hypothetical protein
MPVWSDPFGGSGLFFLLEDPDGATVWLDDIVLMPHP